MKIVSLGPAYPLRGGIAKFNESLSLKLREKGHELILFSYAYQYPAFLFPGRTQFTVDGVNPGLDIRTELHSIWFPGWHRSVEKILHEKPDLVIVHYWMPFFAFHLNYILSRLKKKSVPAILLAHNLIPHEKQPGTRFLTSRLLKNISGLVCLSKSVRNDALGIFPVKNLVLPHPVYDIYGKRIRREQALQLLGLAPEFEYILFFGLVRSYKGLDLLLRAVPYFEHNNLKVLVAGEFYDKKEDYLKIIEEEHIGEKLILKDYFIPDSQVKLYFSASSLVVQPYKSATQSGVTQIAYHFGVPMVVTGVGGLPEMVEDGKTGFICETRAESVAQAVNNFFRSGNRQQFEDEVKRKSVDFSWESFTSRFLEFSKEI